MTSQLRLRCQFWSALMDKPSEFLSYFKVLLATKAQFAIFRRLNARIAFGAVSRTCCLKSRSDKIEPMAERITREISANLAGLDISAPEIRLRQGYGGTSAAHSANWATRHEMPPHFSRPRNVTLPALSRVPKILSNYAKKLAANWNLRLSGAWGRHGAGPAGFSPEG
jgi:hypothetical protein